MKLAAVGADRALAEQRVVGRRLFHFRHHLGAIMRIAAHRIDRLEIVDQARIHASLHHGRHRLVLHALGEALGKRAGAVVQIPVEGFREVQALSHLEAEGVDVVDEQQQSRELLTACDDAELRCLLDGVGGVATGVRHADDLGLGSLRLQQERGEVRRIQGMPDGADNLAARLDHDCGGVAFQRVAERVVCGQEVPGVAAGFHQRLPGAVGEHVGVIDPVNCVRRALGIGEVRRRRAGIDHDDVLFLHQIVDGQRNAGVQHVHEDIDLLDVDPLASGGGADVGLVLVVGRHDVDLPALGCKAGILDRHLGGKRGACAAEVGVKSGIVGKHADLDGLVLRHGATACGKRERGAEEER